MADINEEQLLNGLLRDLGAADVQMGRSDLEARVLAAWDADHEKGYGPSFEKEGRTPFSRASYIVGIAAMVTLAVMVTLWNLAPNAPVAPVALVAPNTPVAPTSARGASAFAQSATADKTADKTVGKPVAPVALIAPVAPVAPIASFAPDVAITQSPLAQSPLTQSPLEFVPLLPMTEHELTGSFQIVRVQMPRASLGSLTSPMHHPSELVEADVLLGEDGRARAIHISTSGSVYPWRPR